MNVAANSLPISSIIVDGRHRKDLGDIKSLASSIASLGMMHPIVVTGSKRLIAGERRLRAAESLGWSEIAATVVEGLDDAKKALQAERDENTCRKDMTPSEKVALGAELEALEKPKARERQTKGINQHSEPSEKFTEGSKGQTREIVGEAVGMSGVTYARAKAVVKADETGIMPDGRELDEDGRKVAREAREEMDRTGKVSGAYDKVNAAAPKTKQPASERSKQIANLASRGYRAEQIAAEIGVGTIQVRRLARNANIKLVDADIGKTRRIDPTRVITESVNALEGIAMGLGLIAGASLAAIDKQLLQGWSESIAASMKTVGRVRKQIMEAL